MTTVGASSNGRSRPVQQLVIGLDAMEWDLVGRWAQEGKLPTFRRLIDGGMRAELATTSAQLPDTVWASLCTGSNPAKFEKFFYVQYDARTLALRHVPDDAIRRAPFWDYLSAAGLRVGVVDMPKFPLSRALNGFQLTNWGAHATKTARASHPASLLASVRARFGDHPVGDCDSVSDNTGALRNLRRRVLDGVRLHGRLFRSLMQEQAWDVFVAGFSAPHCVGHHFWRFVDRTHAQYQAARADGLASTIEDVYRAIDREIGEMLALLSNKTVCTVVAAHGMGPLYHASWNLPEILELLGYGPPRARAEIAPRARDARVNPWRIVKMVVPGWVQYGIKAALPRALQDHLLFRWYTGGIDWTGWRAFAIPNNDSVGAIRVSVKGRDRGGLVERGEEYRRVCGDIATALHELSDPLTGRPIVKRVTLTHEEFHGPFLDQLPDLTVLWDQSFPWEALHSPRFGTLRLRRQDARSGSHSAHGFAIMTGPGVPPGTELTGCSIYDIAPTILRVAGLPVPSDMDGQPLLLSTAAARG